MEERKAIKSYAALQQAANKIQGYYRQDDILSKKSKQHSKGRVRVRVSG